MILLPREGFMQEYPIQLQADAEKLHCGITELVEQEQYELVDAMVRDLDAKSLKSKSGKPARQDLMML